MACSATESCDPCLRNDDFQFSRHLGRRIEVFVTLKWIIVTHYA